MQKTVATFIATYDADNNDIQWQPIPENGLLHGGKQWRVGVYQNDTHNAIIVLIHDVELENHLPQNVIEVTGIAYTEATFTIGDFPMFEFSTLVDVYVALMLEDIRTMADAEICVLCGKPSDDCECEKWLN